MSRTIEDLKEKLGGKLPCNTVFYDLEAKKYFSNNEDRLKKLGNTDIILMEIIYPDDYPVEKGDFHQTVSILFDEIVADEKYNRKWENWDENDDEEVN